MIRLSDLIAAISKADMSEEDKADALDIIRSKINVLLDYIGVVTATEVLKDMMKTGCGSDSEEYMYMKAEENRKRVRDECVKACERLNRLCDDAGIERICDFDIDNGGKVAEYIGHVVMELYRKGIGCE